MESPAPSLCFPQLVFSWLPHGCSGTPSPKSWAQGSVAFSVFLWGSSILSSTGILKSCPALSTGLAPVSPSCLCLVDLVFLLLMTTSRWFLQRVFASVGLCPSCCHLSLPCPYCTSPAVPSAATSLTLSFQRIQCLYPPKVLSNPGFLPKILAPSSLSEL